MEKDNYKEWYEKVLRDNRLFLNVIEGQKKNIQILTKEVDKLNQMNEKILAHCDKQQEALVQACKLLNEYNS